MNKQSEVTEIERVLECSPNLRPASFGVLSAFGQGQHHGKTQEAFS